MSAQKTKIISLFSILILSSCSTDLTPQDGQDAPIGRDEARKSGFGKLFGDDFLFFGSTKKYDPSKGGGTASVNPTLWKASLEVISFMPLASSDAAGGVIITDWYSAPNKSNERIKINITITDRSLRADALKVTIHKEVKGRSGEWVSTTVERATMIEIEDLILTKARQLKVEKKA